MPTTTLDLNVIFQAVEIAAIVGGVGMTLFKLGRLVSRFEIIGRQQATEISEIKSEIKTLNTLLTTVAVQKAEMANMREDFTMLRRTIDELRHGVGMIRFDKAS